MHGQFTYTRRDHGVFRGPAAAPGLLLLIAVLLDNQIVRMLLPLWGVAFVAGLVMTACHR